MKRKEKMQTDSLNTSVPCASQLRVSAWRWLYMYSHNM